MTPSTLRCPAKLPTRYADTVPGTSHLWRLAFECIIDHVVLSSTRNPSSEVTRPEVTKAALATKIMPSSEPGVLKAVLVTIIPPPGPKIPKAELCYCHTIVGKDEMGMSRPPLDCALNVRPLFFSSLRGLASRALVAGSVTLSFTYPPKRNAQNSK